MTNWHVLTGFHPDSGQAISSDGATPDSLRIWLHTTEQLGKWDSYDLPLYNNQGRPLWREHTLYKSKVDVALLPVKIPGNFRSFPINKVKFDDFKIEVSQDVFIIGFPKGMTGSGRFPIWKRGSIATEPEINLDNLPKLLVDTATRKGMSGSPVVVYKVGINMENPPNLSDTDWFGTGCDFLGVYSGRLSSKDEFEAQLGIVWKASVIEEIIISGSRPK